MVIYWHTNIGDEIHLFLEIKARETMLYTYFNDTEAIASKDLIKYFWAHQNADLLFRISCSVKRMAVGGNCKTRKFYN